MNPYEDLDRVTAKAVAAERERLADLADRLAATVPTGDGPMPFAWVIRHQQSSATCDKRPTA